MRRGASGLERSREFVRVQGRAGTLGPALIPKRPVIRAENDVGANPPRGQPAFSRLPRVSPGLQVPGEADGRVFVGTNDTEVRP